MMLCTSNSFVRDQSVSENNAMSSARNALIRGAMTAEYQLDEVGALDWRERSGGLSKQSAKDASTMTTE